MFKSRKIIAFVMCLTIVFSLVSGFGQNAYAIKTNLPEINKPAVDDLYMVEPPAHVQGVDYKFKTDIKRLPSNLQYQTKPMTITDIAEFGADDSNGRSSLSPAGTTLPAANISSALDSGFTASGISSVTGLQAEKVDPKSVKGIKYPPGSKFLVLGSNTPASFAPKMNEIYFDEENGTAFRVLGDELVNEQGERTYAVETPKLTELFEYYKIPRQSIPLTTGNIAYMADEAQLSADSGMHSSSYADGSGALGVVSDIIEDIDFADNKHIITLRPGTVVFQYPSAEERKEDEQAKEKAKKEKFKGDWWEKEQYSDLRGQENDASLSVDIKIKSGTITIENPKFNAYFNIDKWTSKAEANFAFTAKATADVTMEGDLVFNYTLEKCLYGYDIDLGKVAGKEKGNKAFVGIFLVLGVDGKIHVEVRTITTGTAEAGFKYKAYGYGFIPYDVGPYAKFTPETFDMSFTVNGEINAVLACVPQVGVIVWGTELGVLQIWVGFKSKAVFSVSGGGGSSGAQAFKASGSIKLDAFGELVGYLLGKRYSIFYKDFPLYEGAWSVGEEASGARDETPTVLQLTPSVLLQADAFTNIIEGKIAYDIPKPGDSASEAEYIGGQASIDGNKKPYRSGAFTIIIEGKNEDGLPKTYELQKWTDESGKFRIDTDYLETPFNLYPRDSVKIRVDSAEFQDPDTGRTLKLAGTSPRMWPTVPFDEILYNVDAFNDTITGEVSGKYTGPVDFKIYSFNDGSLSSERVEAKNGFFSLETPINGQTCVESSITFEGSKYAWDMEYANLDALEVNFFVDYSKAQAETETNAGSNDNSFPVANVDLDLPYVPDSINDAGEKIDKLAGRDVFGKQIIMPHRITGVINNKGAMGWIESRGSTDVRNSADRNKQADPYDGTIKITEIYIQSALEHMLEMQNPRSIFIPTPAHDSWTDDAIAVPEAYTRKVKNASVPGGYAFETVCLPSSKFVFDEPEAAAFIIELEHEGMTKQIYYNPFETHCEEEPQSMADFIGPLKEVLVSPESEKSDPVVNPAEKSSIWGSVWATDWGTMTLNQVGNKVSGTIEQGNVIFNIQGNVGAGNKLICTYDNGTATGTIQLNLSPDGKSFTGVWDTGSSAEFTGTLQGQKMPMRSSGTPSSENTVTRSKDSESADNSKNTQPEPEKESMNWSGVWETDYGTMILSRDGNRVTGTYDNSDYKITGTVSGNTLKGKFNEDGYTGIFEFLLLEGGKSFSGKYRYDDEEDWSGNWSGRKRNEVVLPPDTQADIKTGTSAWTGVWSSDYGTIMFVQAGSKVYGTYSEVESIIIGTVSGNVLKGTFDEDGYKGEIEFAMFSDGKSFRGKYRYEDETEWADWNGERR